MTPYTAQNYGRDRQQRYRQEAETARLLSLAPRRGPERPTLARALRSIARGLAGYAERLDPTPGRPAWHHHNPSRHVN